ncbi:MAG: DegT/DnrJ/EryC1/StrS family aminotransferase [Magnetococcus sp. WYHC-3]
MSSAYIPVNQPLLDAVDRRWIDECLDSGWVSSEGPLVARFEEALARRVGRRYGVAVSSGSAALDVAVAALRFAPGDEVIVPTFTIISCVSALVRAGVTPVLVDAGPLWNMEVDAVAAAITPRTRAIMAVHIYGLPVDMQPLEALAARHGLALIEDAAEAIGQTCRGQPCGGFGTLSAFSFYPNKHITTGEGGMVLTDDAELAERCRRLRNLCFEPGRRFVHRELGWNYRLTSLQAALGLSQLEKLDRHLAIKRERGRQYDRLLEGCPGLQRQPPQVPHAENLYWVYGLVLDDALPLDAEAALAALHQRGIGGRPFFWPMHEQPVFLNMGLFQGAHYPQAERLARRGFYVPSGLALTPGEVERVAAAVRELVL